MKLIVW